MTLLTAVRNEVTVPLPPQQAFELFTDGLDRWWMRSHTIGESPMQRAVLEPELGGRWYEIDEDGSQHDWGRVLAWEPPHRLVLAWQITADWAYDPALVTEVEVTFTAAGPDATTVTVEHRNLDRFGASGEQMYAVFSSPNGWPGLLRRYTEAIA